MGDYNLAYLYASLFIFFPLWFIFFLRRRDLRHEMITIGFFLGIITLFAQFFYLMKDYWRPIYIFGTYAGIEDFLFGFFNGGIMSIIYEEVFGKVHTKRKDRSHNWFIITASFVTMLFIFFHILVFWIGVNSIYALIFLSAIFIVIIVALRGDFVVDSLMSGLLFGGLYLIIFYLILNIYPDTALRFWFIENLSGIYLFGIPIEGLLWAFSSAALVGPLYEFMMGLRFKK